MKCEDEMYKNSGPETILSESEEKCIEDWILFRSTSDFGVT